MNILVLTNTLQTDNRGLAVVLIACLVAILVLCLVLILNKRLNISTKKQLISLITDLFEVSIIPAFLTLVGQGLDLAYIILIGLLIISYLLMEWKKGSLGDNQPANKESSKWHRLLKYVKIWAIVLCLDFGAIGILIDILIKM